MCRALERACAALLRAAPLAAHLQALWRGHAWRAAHAPLVLLLRKRTTARIVHLRLARLQARRRALPVRATFRACRAAARCLQRWVRARHARRAFLRRRAAAVTLQAAWRGWAAWRTYQPHRQTLALEAEGERVRVAALREAAQLRRHHRAVAAAALARARARHADTPIAAPSAPDSLLLAVDVVRDIGEAFPRGLAGPIAALERRLQATAPGAVVDGIAQVRASMRALVAARFPSLTHMRAHASSDRTGPVARTPADAARRRVVLGAGGGGAARPWVLLLSALTGSAQRQPPARRRRRALYCSRHKCHGSLCGSSGCGGQGAARAPAVIEGCGGRSCPSGCLPPPHQQQRPGQHWWQQQQQQRRRQPLTQRQPQRRGHPSRGRPGYSVPCILKHAPVSAAALTAGCGD